MSADPEDVVSMDSMPVKQDIQRRFSKTRPSDVVYLADAFGIPSDLHPRVPPDGMTMDRLPADAIGLYVKYFFEGGLNIPFSTFLLGVIQYFKVRISQLVPLGLHRATLFEVYCRSMHIPPTTPLFRVFYKLSKQGCWFSFEKRTGNNRKVCFGDFPSSLKGWKEEFFLIDRRAIPFAMPWRHHDSDVSDPFPKGEFNPVHANKLAECIIEPFQVPHDCLYMLGMSSYWKHPGYRAALRDEEGRGIALRLVVYYYCLYNLSFIYHWIYLYAGVTMAEYLKKPPIRRNVNVVKGDRLREGQTIELHLTQPLAAGAPLPEKTDDLLRVEVPDDRVLAAKDKKKEQMARTGSKKPPSGGVSKPSGASKRPADDVSSRLLKRTRTADPSPVIDLDSSEAIPNPSPIRSIPPLKRPSVDGEGGSDQRTDVGGKFETSFFFLLLFLAYIFVEN